MTFTELSEIWLKNYKNNIKPSTYEHYCYVIRTIIQPELGDIPAKKISQLQLNDMFIRLQTQPREKTNVILSTGLIQKTFILTRNIIKYGQKLGKCKNFTPNFMKIKNHNERKSKIKFFEENQCKDIINQCASKINSTNFLYSLGILFGLLEGLRIGEICGLKWDDIDFEYKRISINRTVRLSINPDTKREEFIIGSPKSLSSQRTIPLNDYLYNYLLKLKTHHKYDGYIIRIPKLYNEQTALLPCSPRVLRNNYNKLLEDLNIPKRNFHSLRHTFASIAIQHNVDPKTLSEILGHADVKITLNLYVHSNEKQKQNCVNVFNKFCYETVMVE